MSAPKRGQWHRDAWQNALTTDPRTKRMRTRAVALVFAKYAGRGDTASVTLTKLEDETGGARETVSAGVHDLRQTGWLTETVPSAGRRAATYCLTYPPGFDPRPRGRDTQPQTGPGRGRDTQPQAHPLAVGDLAVEVGNGVPRGRETGPNQSIKVINSPLTPAEHLASRLGWRDDDERLAHVSEWLRAAKIHSPARFLAKLPADDLERQYLAYLADLPHVPPTFADPNVGVVPATPTAIRRIRTGRPQE